MQVSGPHGPSSSFEVTIATLDGGLYACEGIPPSAGMHYLTVLLNGTERVAGTPLKVRA